MNNNNFSSADVKNVINMINQNEDSISAIAQLFSNETDYKKAATTYLVKELKISADDAADIVANLSKGITEFSSQMDAATTPNNSSFEEMLSRMTKNMTNEEKKNCYVNILTALQLINIGTVDLTEDEIADRHRRNALNDEAVLLSELEKEFDNTLNLQEVGEAVKNGIDKDSLHEVAEILRKSKDGYRMAVAIWMYCGQCEGKMKLTESQVPLTAKDLGLLASASVEAMLATDDLAQGKITLEKWQTIMKWILGILIFTTLFVATITLTAVAIAAAMEVISTAIASEVVAFLLSVLAFGAIFYVAEGAVGGILYLMSWLGKVYDRNIGKVTQKIKSFLTKIKALITKQKQKRANEKAEDVSDTDLSQTEEQINTATKLAFA